LPFNSGWSGGLVCSPADETPNFLTSSPLEPVAQRRLHLPAEVVTDPG
jgi:hypothetical protein